MTSQARRAEIAIAEAAEQWARQRSLTDRGCHPDFEEKAKATFLAELSRLTAQVEELRLPRVDVIRLRKLAATMKSDMESGMTGLNKGAVLSIVEIMEVSLGAPLMQFTSEAAANVADKEYPGSPSMRHAFNHGVKWAQEQFNSALAACPGVAREKE